MDWARILAYVTGMVDQELLARNEYLAAENRILKSQLNGRLRLSDARQQSTDRGRVVGRGGFGLATCQRHTSSRTTSMGADHRASSRSFPD
jgi:hypothetical protein